MTSAVVGAALRRRRERLPQGTDAFRWLDGELDGVTVDLFGAVAVMSLYRELAPDEELALANALCAAGPATSVYVKRRPREAKRSGEDAARVAPAAPLAGEPVEAFVCHELGLGFEIRPGNGLSVGLYLDARDARGWVRAQAAGQAVLNLFAYTCGFGVAARAGGARRTLNVDVSKKVLEWGRVNYGHNGLAAPAEDFVSGDAFEWLKRLGKKGERFGLIVADPPGFATTRASRFTAARDYHRLVAAAVPLLAPGGRLLALCNVAELSASAFEAQVVRGGGGAPLRVVERLGASGVDFALPSSLKGVVVALG